MVDSDSKFFVFWLGSDGENHITGGGTYYLETGRTGQLELDC